MGKAISSMTAFVAIQLVSFASAQMLDTDVYPQDAHPSDSRTADLIDLNGYFPFDPVPASRQAWQNRAAEIRQRILVSAGLWPMPERPAVKATIHGRVDRDDYTIEKVFFESFPGLYVTGNLYRPKGRQGWLPVVLSPHGHWNKGRFYESPQATIDQQILDGAERHEIAARYPLQARCVHLARMGCIVFHYDMVGYADSKPITYERAHRHSTSRPELENAGEWGLFTAQAEMRLQNIFGMQTFNSLRAFDFVASLPDVDANRIGVTGASGGGTQTMILAAVEPRVNVSFPAVMVSTAMQGGCPCENACCLRVGTGNVEFAALFCPKPQGINAANDWTVELAAKGLPELKKLYKLFGAEKNIEGYSLVQFPHNYNYVSRGKMYAWMNRHFEMGHSVRDLWERPFVQLSVKEMSVWNESHPAPASDLAAEIELLRTMSNLSQQQLAHAEGKERKSIVKAAIETITATGWNEIGPVERENISKTDMGDFWAFKDILRYDRNELPIMYLYPKNWKRNVVVWTAAKGKSSLLNDEQELRDEAKELLEAGFAIAAPDLFRQGEFESGEVQETRKVANDRDFAGYTFGYNRTLLAHRVEDLLALLKFIKADEHGPETTILLGVEGGTPPAVVAAALAQEELDRIVIDDREFRFSKLKSWRHPDFLPGAVKYGDLPAIMSLAHRAKSADDLNDAVAFIKAL